MAWKRVVPEIAEEEVMVCLHGFKADETVIFSENV